MVVRAETEHFDHAHMCTRGYHISTPVGHGGKGGEEGVEHHQPSRDIDLNLNAKTEPK